MDNNTYHADTSHVSKSGLDKIAITPAHYYHHYIAGHKSEPTRDMHFGSALHEAIFEPVEYWTKKEYEPYRDQIKKIRAAIQRHPIAAKYLQSGRAEVPSFFICEGVKCKVKADWLPDGSDLIIDLKTTTDASPSGFRRAVRKYRYHVADALYSIGLQRTQMMFIAVEKKPPYRVECHVLGDDLREEGRALLSRDLSVYNECNQRYLKTGDASAWPNYQKNIIHEL